MTAAMQKKRGKTRKKQTCELQNGQEPMCDLHTKTGSNMKNGYAIIMRRTKRIVGFAPTIEIARAGLDAVDVPFRQNFTIVPYINDKVPANER